MDENEDSSKQHQLRPQNELADDENRGEEVTNKKKI